VGLGAGAVTARLEEQLVVLIRRVDRRAYAPRDGGLVRGEFRREERVEVGARTVEEFGEADDVGRGDEGRGRHYFLAFNTTWRSSTTLK
jgi:hypothetical protein